MTRRTSTKTIREADEILPPDGEQLVIKDERTIRREPIPHAPTAPDEPDRPDEHDDDDDDEDGQDERREDGWTIDSFLDQLDGSTSATVIVLRLPDGYQHKGTFHKPCSSVMRCEPVRLEPGMTPEDLYSTVREMNESGGRYRFQLRAGQGFGESWEQVLSDPRGQGAQSQSSTQPAVQPATLEGEMERFANFTRLLKESVSNMGYTRRGEAAQITAPSEPPATPADQVKTMVDTLASIKTIFGDMNPQPAPSGSGLLSGLAQLVGALGLRDVLPQLIQLAVVSAMKQQGITTPPVAAYPPQVAANPPAATVLPFPGARAVEPEAAEEKDAGIVFEDALTDMVKGNPVDEAAADLVTLSRQPTTAEFIPMILSAPALNVLQTLLTGHEDAEKIIGDPANVAWVESLQVKTRELLAQGGAA